MVLLAHRTFFPPFLFHAELSARLLLG